MSSRSPSAFLLHTRAGAIAGTALLFGALSLFRSYENRLVLGRWSYPFFAVWLLCFALLVATVLWGWRSRRRYSELTSTSKSRMALVDLGLLSWGGAYLSGALDDPTTAGRLTDLTFFGSVYIPSVILEWIALALLFAALLLFAVERLPASLRGPLSLIATIGLIAVLGEGAVRARSLVAPTPQGMPTYSGDMWQRRNVSLNSLGFRDVDRDLDKSKQVRRLLVVGDSFAFGWGIDRTEGRFGEQLARVLSRETATAWEPMSAARGDTHTGNHIDFLKTMLPYEPDAVVLLYVFNDIDYLHPVTPRRVASKRSLFALFYRNSHLFQEICVRVRLIRHTMREASESDPYFEPSTLSRHLQDVSRFVELARSAGADTWVIPFSIGADVDENRLVRCELFVTRAADAGIPILDTCRTFLDETLSDMAVNRFDAHPNERANLMLADEVASHITNLLRDAR